ncbi:hypothetical protein M758_10G064300 [Ceratodon purpureus]|nr:hypothetical protein M758_10G064300 [Ceratodon purpureus]
MTSQALNDTSNQSLGIVASLSRSQVIQFLGSDSVSGCPSTPPYKRSPLNLPTTSVSSPRHIINTVPVMHPNLVYTLKSILSLKNFPAEVDNANTSEDSRSGAQSDNSQPSEHAEMQGSGKENTLGLTDYNGQASPGRSASLPSRDKSQVEQQEAMVIPVDLIQNRRPYQCAFMGCQRTFKNPQTMRMHHKTHFCDAAAARLGAEAAFQAGISSQPGSPLKAGHNKKIASRCPTCHKTFVGLYELRRHYGRKHSAGEKRHACRMCGKRFHVEVDVRDHEKLCGKPIVCKCGLKFAFKCNLVAHKRSHPKCQERATMAEKTLNPSSHDQQVQDERRFSGMVVAQEPPLNTTDAADVKPARLQSASVKQVVDLPESASSFPSSYASCSTTFVAEAVGDVDTSTSSVDLRNFSISSGLSQADSYIKFPFDHYFLAALSTSVHQVPHRLSN